MSNPTNKSLKKLVKELRREAGFFLTDMDCGVIYLTDEERYDYLMRIIRAQNKTLWEVADRLEKIRKDMANG